MGIRARTILVMGICSLVALIVIGIANYNLSVRHARDEARTKASLVLNYARATKAYLKKTQRPLVMELVEEDRFYPELMSGFVVARGTYDEFKAQLPGYEFKQATIDPLFLPNKANADEVGIIQTFRENPDLKTSEGVLLKNGEDHFYLAQPITVESQGCLKCHGDPNDAPKDQIEIYGSENGYHWKKDDTVAAFMVYVPIRDALEAARNSATLLFVIGAGCILLAIIGVWIFLDRKVVSPIVQLSARTEEISLGKNLENNVERKSNDEVGLLAQAIERLRISMVKMLERRSHD